MLTHLGAGSRSRRHSSCGAKATTEDEVKVDRVTCVKCIKDYLKRYRGLTARPVKFELWEKRLAELEEEPT